MDNPHPRTQATIDQLRAEIQAAHRNPTSVAEEIGVNAALYRRYLKLKTEMPMSRLYASLDALGLPDEIFFKRARERFDQNSEH